MATELELATLEPTTGQVVVPAETQNEEPETALIPENLPPMDRGRGAWLFCLSGSVLEMLIWGFGYSFGVFQSWYTSNPPFSTQSPVAVTAIGATALGVQYFESVLVMALLQIRPEWTRMTMWACVAACSLSLLLSSFATQVWQLILLQGILFGGFAGTIYFPLLFWVYEWFSEKRSLASGLIFAGSGLGGVVFPLMASYLLETLGYHWTLRIWAAMFLVVGCLAMLGAKPRIPVIVTRAQGRPYNIQRYLKQFHFVSKPLFVLNSSIILLQGLGFFPVSLYIPTYTSTLGFSPFTGSLVLATFNLVCVVSPIVVGFICDRVDYLQVIFWSAIFSSVAAFTLLGFAGSLSLVFVFAVIFGSLAGGFTSVWTAAAVETSEGDPALRGPILLGFGWARGMASILGPIIAGLLYERSREKESRLYGGHGFINLTVFVGAMMFATGLLGAGTAWWRKSHRR